MKIDFHPSIETRFWIVSAVSWEVPRPYECGKHRAFLGSSGPHDKIN